MNNFQYYNPVRIVFGEGQIKELANLVPKNAKVLITYGGQSAKKQARLMKSSLPYKAKTVKSMNLGGLNRTQNLPHS